MSRVSNGGGAGKKVHHLATRGTFCLAKSVHHLATRGTFCLAKSVHQR